MQVRVISYTAIDKELLSEFHHQPNLTDLIAYCARVSNPDNAANQDTSARLIEYLAKNAHWSPFEMVSVCLEITTTRDISRQILRHRSFSFQEFSQRYAKVADFVTREARLQDTKNRQNSIQTDDNTLRDEWKSKQEEIINKSKEVYEWALSKGIAKEQARVVLPEGLTVTKLFMNGTIRSWIHYCQLRTHNGTQLEHAEIAKAIASVINKICPNHLFDHNSR